MKRVGECAGEVPELVRMLVEGDQDGIHVHARRISQLEGLADDAKTVLRSDMPLKLMLPVDRRDVLKLVTQIDAIADSAEDVAVLLTLRTMEVPEEMKTLLGLFVERVLECVRTAEALVETLDPLLATGFGGAAADKARGIITELHRKEHETDKLQDQLAKVLFQQEDRMSPVAIFMWMKILEEIGEMADHAENVGDLFTLFMAH